MGKKLNSWFMRFQAKGFMSVEIQELVKGHVTYVLITSLVEGDAS